MGILCGHWNCGGSFGLGIAEDHGIRNRNDMGVDTGKNPYSVLYSARVYCGWSHYRDISKVIRDYPEDDIYLHLGRNACFHII